MPSGRADELPPAMMNEKSRHWRGPARINTLYQGAAVIIVRLLGCFAAFIPAIDVLAGRGRNTALFFPAR